MPALTFVCSSVGPCHIPECKAYMGTGRRLARTCNTHMVVGLNWISVWSFWPTLKCYYCVHTCTNRSHQREKMNQSLKTIFFKCDISYERAQRELYNTLFQYNIHNVTTTPWSLQSLTVHEYIFKSQAKGFSQFSSDHMDKDNKWHHCSM